MMARDPCLGDAPPPFRLGNGLEARAAATDASGDCLSTTIFPFHPSPPLSSLLRSHRETAYPAEPSSSRHAEVRASRLASGRERRRRVGHRGGLRRLALSHRRRERRDLELRPKIAATRERERAASGGSGGSPAEATGSRRSRRLSSSPSSTKLRRRGWSYSSPLRPPPERERAGVGGNDGVTEKAREDATRSRCVRPQAGWASRRRRRGEASAVAKKRGGGKRERD